MRTELAPARGPATITEFVETHRQAGEWESFTMKEGCALIGGCWHREDGGGPPGSRGHLMWLVWGAYFAFSDWS